jgi:hypothetical protein
MFDRVKIRLTIPLAYHNNLFKKDQIVEACFRFFEKPHLIGVNWLPLQDHEWELVIEEGDWDWNDLLD